MGNSTTNKIWLSANDSVFNDAGATPAGDGNNIEEWHDRSGNGNDAVQTTAGSQPTLTTNSINGQSTVTFDGSADWMSIVTGDIPETNYTQFVIYKSSDDNGCFTAIASPATYTGGAHDRQFGLNSSKLTSRIWNSEVISSVTNYNDNTARIAEIQVTSGVGQEIFINEASVKTGTKGSSDFNWEAGMVLGGHSAWGYYSGSISEVILYNTVINDAQQIIVNNYLASKYGITIVNDRFSYDNVHFYDVAGIGREDGSNEHLAAQSAGILQISAADDLDDDEYLLFGHDNGSISSWTTTEAPDGGAHIQRVAREWRFDHTGDVGTVTLELDTALFPARPSTYISYVLLVDSDGNFSSGATAYPLVSSGGSLYEASGLSLSAGDYVTFAIIEPAIDFTLASSDDDEPNGPVSIEISLSYALDQDIAVEHDIIGRTTINATDYTLVSGTATITTGNTTVDLSVPLTNDTDIEDDEDFIVELSNPSLGTLGTNTQHTFTIHDDDNPRKITFSAASGNGDESVTPGQFALEINLTDGSNPTTVDYIISGGSATGGGVDYILADGTATIAAGDNNVTVDIFINEDGLDEADETIVISLSNPINANLGATTSFTYTINDNDTEPEVEFALAASSGLESISPANIQVKVSTVAGQDITVDYTITPGTATGGGVDYTLADGTLTIPKDSSYYFISPQIINDAIEEGGESFTITLSNPGNATLGSQTTHEFTISDDDNTGFTGPGGVGDENSNKIWLSANDNVYNDAGTTEASDGESVEEWHDRSGNGNDAVQTTGGSQPTLTTNSINGQSVMTFDGSADWMGITTGDIPETNYTQFVIFKSSDGDGCFTAITDPVSYSGGSHDRQFGLKANKMSSRIWSDETISTATSYNDNNTHIAEWMVTNGVGQEIYIDETSVKTGSKSASDFNWETGMVLGGHNAWGYYSGAIAEVILYNTLLNDAQQIIVNNYLSSKYGVSIANDRYGYDASHKNDVAGIGREDASNEHLAAQSAGILKVGSATSLGNGDYLLFGHDKGDITTWTTAEAPNAGTNIQRLAREWRLDETGDVGNVSIGIDTTDLPARPSGYTRYFLLVDADGNFSSGATLYPMSNTGGSNYQASNVSVSDGNYLAIAVVRPIIQFTSVSSSKFEPNSPATMQISLSFALDADVTVDYAVTSGTATPNVDYVFADGTATILAGNTTTNLNVSIINDVEVESDETMVVTLSNPTSGIEIGDNVSDTLRINDDDNSRKVSFRTTTGSGDEAVSPVSVTVQINSVDAVNPTTVMYAVSGGTAVNGSDYVLATGTATIPANEDSITFDIAITDDATYEDDETITVVLYSPSNCNLLSSNTTYTYTITDNDTKPTIEFAQLTSSNNEYTSPALLAVILSAPTGIDVTVDYSVTGGTASGSGVDFTLADGTLTIAAGDTTGDISIDIIDDALVEAEETIEVTLSNPTNADPGTDLVTTLTINDDDNDGYVGPGGVGEATNNKIWLSANDYVYTDAGSTEATNGTAVQEWHDRSGNGNDAVQTTGGSQPTLVTNSINGQSVLTFDGTADWMSIVTSDIPETNYTEFVIFKSSDVTGPFTTIASPATYTGGAHDRQFGLSSNKLSSRIYNTEVISTASNYNDNTARIAEIQVTSGSGQELFINEASVKTGTKGGSDFNWEAGMVVGGHTAWGYYAGSIAEVILYNTVLNDAQQIIVNNYLSSKYGVTIVNDKFSYDAGHNYDVAGIGREDASNLHTAAQSAGMFLVHNASAMGDGEYLLFGHDDGAVDSWTSTEAPTASGSERIEREWRFGETGDVGTISVTIDTSLFDAKPAGYQAMMLAVDGDGDFSSGATMYPLIYVSGSNYRATSVAVADGDYMTVVVGQNITQQTGDFDDPTTWLIGIVPGTGEDALIATGHVVDLTANQSIGSLTINGTLNLNNKSLTVDLGTITNTGTFNAGTGTVNYGASGNQDVAALNYYKLTLSGSGTKTLAGNVDVDSDLLITGSGITLDVSGSNYDINLGGKWNNNGTFTPRSASVIFDGAGTQNLTANTAQTFTDLTISKSSGNVKLLRNTTINGVLDMSSGNLELGSFDLTMGASATISNGSSSSYIEADGIGVLKKIYTSVPAPAFTMPLGDVNDYSPFTFTLQDGTLGGLAYVTIKVKDSKHPNLSGTSDYISRYWVVTPSGISCNGACDEGAGDIEYDMSYTYVDADINGDESQYIAMKYSGGSWLTGGSVNTGTNTLTWNGVTSFSDMTGGDGDEALPIELLFFDAALNNDTVNVDWRTATETNNHFFTVERSKDGIHYEAIDTLEAAGNSQTIRHYATIDAHPYEGLSYYRLKQTDFDGKTETFAPVPVNNNDGSGASFMTIFPNPAKTTTYVMLERTSKQEEEVLVVLQDMFGKTHYSKVVFLSQAGSVILALDMLDKLKPGVYLVTGSSRYGIESKRLVVE
ncbi:MAG: hypothetical protein KDD36_01095 [Flavobacteriales bacterium]|nr:hypothetical protein [Flavobacteriales bacterium]